MSNIEPKLPNPEYLPRVEAAMLYLRLDMFMSLTDPRIEALTARLFEVFEERGPMGDFSIPPDVISRAQDIHAADTLLPGQFMSEPDAIRMHDGPTAAPELPPDDSTPPDIDNEFN